MMVLNKEFTVLDQQGRTQEVPGYQQANQLAREYLDQSDTVIIVIRITKDKQNESSQTL